MQTPQNSYCILPKVWSMRGGHSSAMQPSFSGEDRPVSSARAGWKSIILLLNQNIKQMLLVGKKNNFLVGWKQCHFV